MVVDDDFLSAKLLGELLTHEGCKVQTAYSAEEALAILRGFSPRVVVVDLLLPRMSGLLFAQQLKAEPANHGTVLVAVTSFGPDVERLALEAGCVALVRKPVELQQFVALIAEHLGKATPGDAV